MATLLADYVALQSQGARIANQAGVRRGGAGPADALACLIDGHPIMIPALGLHARTSDYALVADQNELRLEKNGNFLCQVKAVPRPAFYDGQTADGIPYSHIARLHGQDCLASTVVQECVRYNNSKTRCRFCAIGASLAQNATLHTKTPAQLAEVALAAKRLDKVSHVTLTAGTCADPDAGALYLAQCAQAIWQASALPVEIQFEPLRDKKLYATFKSMGVSDVGMHIESFDPQVRQRMTPGKAEISLEQYFTAFADAVAVFGRNKVSTYVILGLGEDEELTLAGYERAAALGVYPVAVPLRPLVDSCLAKAPPIDPHYLKRMYRKMGIILKKHGLSAEASTAGCARCKACSLLQFTENARPRTKDTSARSPDTRPVPRLHSAEKARPRTGEASAPNPAPNPDAGPLPQIRPAGNKFEIQEYMRLRREVFVDEQDIFTQSDADSHDDKALVLVAEVNREIVGGVRCYPLRQGIWYGGRLVVCKQHRNAAQLGALLVKQAVDCMCHKPEVRRFFALVQGRNVRFFQRLGWIKRGKVFVMHGIRHQVMERLLDSITTA